MTSALNEILYSFGTAKQSAEETASLLVRYLFGVDHIEPDSFTALFTESWLYQALLAHPNASLEELLEYAQADRALSPQLKLNLGEFTQRLSGELNAESALEAATPITVETKRGPIRVFNRNDAIVLQFPYGERHELSLESAMMLGRVLQMPRP